MREYQSLKRKVLIVGSGFKSLNSYLEDHNYDYIILKDRLKTKFPNKKLKNRVVCDFSSKEKILSTVDSIGKNIDAVITVYEDYVLPTAWISEHLNLPGMPIDSVKACTDKFLMRQLFAKASEKISPDFMLVSSAEDIISFAKSHSFPIILKPANLAKSLLVTKSHDMEELIENYDRTVNQIDAIYAKYAPHRKPKILIEEFLEGTVHSVEAFVDKDGKPHILEKIVDYQTGYDIGFDDNFHYSRILPSKLSDEKQESVKHCAELGSQALGMKNSAAHIEIIMTKEGPRIVEIGARSGGYRERMHMLANSIDISKAILAISFGEEIDIESKKDEPCAVLELFPKKAGVFKGLSNEDGLNKLESLFYLKKKVKEGEFTGKSSDGYKMTAVIILHNKDKDQFNKDLEFVNSKVSVITD